jgi:tetratricopeptide (TPR) repeat protein
MNIRPKTTRRLLILLGTIAAVVGAASVLIAVQLRRYEKHRLAFRAVAMDAYRHGDYRTAIADFPRYLGKDHIDSEAIFDYAVARSKVPTANLSYLTDARKLFARYLELNPDDTDAQHHLLDIYQQLKYSAESSALIDQLLAKNADDIPALSAQLGEKMRDHRYDLALPIALHLCDLNPLDIQTQVKACELMASAHKPPGEIIGRADQLLKAHPQDPRFELLRGVAARVTGDLDGTRQWLLSAATRPTPGADFTLMLAGAMDRMQMWNQARRMLEQNASAAGVPPQIKAGLVQRLWEAGEYDPALQVLAGLNPNDPAADSNLIGLSALVHFSKDRGRADPDFKADLSALKQRTDDLPAMGWTCLLEAVTDQSPPEALEPARLCQSAMRSDPNNPDVRFYLGLEYLRLGESELALQYLSQTTQMQPEWDAPLNLIARTLLQRGQALAAMQYAQAACERNPQSPADQITFALVSYQRLSPAASAADIRPVLGLIQQLRSVDPSDASLMAAEIDLLARSDQKQDAIDHALAILATSAGQEPAALKMLAEVDQMDHLGLTGPIIEAAARCHPTTPEAALDLVKTNVSCGNIDSAKSLLDAMRLHSAIDWRLARLQGRESAGDTQTVGDWEKLSDAFDRDLTIQQAALRSPAVKADRSLMDRVIDRLKSITGDDAMQWKIARAQWQLGAADNVVNNANAAAASMAEIAPAAPRYALPQIVWADALVKAGDINGAIAHLKLAAQIEPENSAIGMQLAALLQQQGRTHDMKAVLEGLRTTARLNDPQRMEIAQLLSTAGDRAEAIKAITDNQPIHPQHPDRDLLLAELYEQTGRETDAQNIFDNWMRQKNPPLAVVVAAARFEAMSGRIDHARQMLAALPADQKDAISGEFESRFGDPKIAQADFEQVTRQSPGNREVWLMWAGMHLRNRDFAGAFAVAGQGLKSLPGDAALSAMAERSQTLAGLPLDADAQPLLDAISVDPTNESAAATVAALSGSESSSDASDRLGHLADSYPRFLPLQVMVIGRDLKAGLYDPAIERATRLCEIFPTDPLSAQWLAIACSTAGRKELALSAAMEWRNRSLVSPHQADLAIAAAQIALNHPREAAEQVAWYPTEQIAADKDRAMELYARAICMEGRSDDAWNILQPDVVGSADWRRRWLAIVTDTAPDAASGRQQIEQTAALSNSPQDQLSLARAWLGLYQRFGDRSLLSSAAAVIEPLAQRAPADAGALLLLGDVRQKQNDLPTAEIAYRNALKIAPDSAAAKNNLAMILLLRKEDLNSAQSLAMSAVNLAPASSACHSTLGEVDLRTNDLDSARTEFQTALRLEGENVEALTGLGSAQQRSGNTSAAAATLRQVEILMQANHPKLTAIAAEELDQLRRAVHSGAK